MRLTSPDYLRDLERAIILFSPHLDIVWLGMRTNLYFWRMTE